MRLGKTFLIILLFFLSKDILFANDFNSQKGEKIFDEFKVNKRMKFNIPGEWEAIDKFSDYVGWGIKVEGVTFVQMKNDIPVKFFEI